MGDRFCSLLAILKRKEKSDLYWATERNCCIQTGSKLSVESIRPWVYTGQPDGCHAAARGGQMQTASSLGCGICPVTSGAGDGLVFQVIGEAEDDGRGLQILSGNL